jgi:hypothetical protein
VTLLALLLKLLWIRLLVVDLWRTLVVQSVGWDHLDRLNGNGRLSHPALYFGKCLKAAGTKGL